MTNPSISGAPESAKTLERIATAVNDWVGAHRIFYLSAAALSSLFAFSGYAHAKTVWMDEALLLTISRLKSLSLIKAALMDGIQTDPPTLQVLVHYLFQIFGEHVFLARLPAILGFTLMCVSLSLLLWRHVAPVYAAAVFFLPYATALRTWAMDARPYGMMMGFSALALLCWDGMANQDSRHRNAWRIGYALSLGAAFSTHFYSILLLGPLVIGELCRWILRKKVDWWMPLCTALGLIPYAIWLPILRSGMRVFQVSDRHYHGHVAFETFYDFYAFAVASMPMVVLLFLLAGTVLMCRGIRPARGFEWGMLAQRPRVLLGAVLGFLLLPAVGYTAGVLVTGFFIQYYHMIAAFGVIIGLPLLLATIAGQSRAIGLSLLLAVGAQGAMVTARGISGFRRHNKGYPRLAQLRALIPETNPDIVVNSAAEFMPFHEATRGEQPDNLLFLFDRQKCLEEAGANTADILYEKLQPYTDGRIEPFLEYTAAHRHFYITLIPGTRPGEDWIFRYLMKHQAGIKWLGQAGDFDLFRIDLPPDWVPQR